MLPRYLLQVGTACLGFRTSFLKWSPRAKRSSPRPTDCVSKSRSVCPVSILWVDQNGLLHPLSGPSLSEAYSASIEGMAIGPMVGSCGSAAYLGVPVAVTNMEADPRWAEFKELALRQNLKACWSSPICNEHNHVVGTFAFYYHETRGPTPEEQAVVDACVHLCAIALERYKQAFEREPRASIDALTELQSRASFDATLSSLTCDQPRHMGASSS
jgi:GAF domain-containing protein